MPDTAKELRQRAHLLLIQATQMEQKRELYSRTVADLIRGAAVAASRAATWIEHADEHLGAARARLREKGVRDVQRRPLGWPDRFVRRWWW